MTQDHLLREYVTRVPVLQKVAHDMEMDARATLGELKHIDRVGFRVKGPEQFVKKALDAKKRYKDPLAEIEDQIGGRVLVFFLDDISPAIERLKGAFNEIESRRVGPESGWEFGYESHHLVCMIPRHCLPPEWASFRAMPKTFELQVRTLFMHAWAEPQHDLGYKGPKDMPRPIQRRWAWAAAAASNGDNIINEAAKRSPGTAEAAPRDVPRAAEPQEAGDDDPGEEPA